MHQHATWPYPIDPNLISQGIPPDDRVTLNDNNYGPLEGTPLPAGLPPVEGAPPGAPPAAAEAPAPQPVTPPNAPGPSVAIGTYDPQSGQFAAPDGTVGRQTDVIGPGPQAWSDLIPTG
jgi:phospholipid/cholesterol/gamma-HCH transport system substrate-binding protein